MATRRDLIKGTLAGALVPGQFIGSTAFGAAAAPALGTIRAVTITAGDLSAVEAAWTKYLEYRVVERGTISKETAASWEAPAVAGKPFISLGPKSGEPTYLRFVQQAPIPDYNYSRTFGWQATEITVQNGDELYERIKDSPFKVNGPPRGIPTYPYLKAMGGTTGPGGEKIHLTWITEKRPDLAVAESFVGRVFIVTQGVPDLPQALEWYKTTFGNQYSPIRKLPSIALSVVTLKNGTKIEVDDFKDKGQPRRKPPGGLPPGVAVVSFECSDFDRYRDKFIAGEIKNPMQPHLGKRSGTMKGSAGEMMELLDVK